MRRTPLPLQNRLPFDPKPLNRLSVCSSFGFTKRFAWFTILWTNPSSTIRLWPTHSSVVIKLPTSQLLRISFLRVFPLPPETIKNRALSGLEYIPTTHGPITRFPWFVCYVGRPLSSSDSLCSGWGVVDPQLASSTSRTALAASSPGVFLSHELVYPGYTFAAWRSNFHQSEQGCRWAPTTWEGPLLPYYRHLGIH